MKLSQTLRAGYPNRADGRSDEDVSFQQANRRVLRAGTQTNARAVRTGEQQAGGRAVGPIFFAGFLHIFVCALLYESSRRKPG